MRVKTKDLDKSLDSINVLLALLNDHLLLSLEQRLGANQTFPILVSLLYLINVGQDFGFEIQFFPHDIV